MFRRRRARPDGGRPSPPLLPVVGPRWRPSVAGADRARERFAAVVAPVPDGPLRERLDELGRHLDEGVAGCWAAATRADRLERVVADLDAERITAAHKEARRVAEAPGSSEVEVEAARLLAGQHARVQGLLNALEDADGRLRLLQLRLDDVVTRAATLALLPDGVAADAGVDADLERLVEELDALRAGLEAVG